MLDAYAWYVSTVRHTIYLELMKGKKEIKGRSESATPLAPRHHLLAGEPAIGRSQNV